MSSLPEERDRSSGGLIDPETGSMDFLKKSLGLQSLLPTAASLYLRADLFVKEGPPSVILPEQEWIRMSPLACAPMGELCFHEAICYGPLFRIVY